MTIMFSWLKNQHFMVPTANLSVSYFMLKLQRHLSDVSISRFFFCLVVVGIKVKAPSTIDKCNNWFSWHRVISLKLNNWYSTWYYLSLSIMSVIRTKT